MAAFAKVLAGLGALLLLGSGVCFLALADGAAPGEIGTPWIVGAALVVGGVLVATALFGAAGRS